MGRSERVTLRYSEALTSGLIAPYEMKQWIDPVGPFGLVFCSSNQAAKKDQLYTRTPQQRLRLAAALLRLEFV